MDLTARVLNSLRAQLGITVSHPDIEGVLKVTGASVDTVKFGWVGMPDEMRSESRMVYCCNAERAAGPIYLFDDEVTVVDAPAELVVDAMLDMMDVDAAYNLQYPEQEEDEDEDWICEGAP